jgi:hypothetical protein
MFVPRKISVKAPWDKEGPHRTSALGLISPPPGHFHGSGMLPNAIPLHIPQRRPLVEAGSAALQHLNAGADLPCSSPDIALSVTPRHEHRTFLSLAPSNEPPPSWKLDRLDSIVSSPRRDLYASFSFTD